jgi:phosphoserine phosphatase
MDSTMIDQECIDELAAEVGVKEKVAEITSKAMNGEIAFEPALRERVALLKGLPALISDQVIKNRITLAKGGKTLVATMKQNGGWCALVSGGFTLFTGPIASMIGFDENHANILDVENNQLTGKVREPILGAEAKVSALNKIAAERNISVQDFIAVGDGANDLPMLETAGTGVALHAKPSVAAKAKIRIDHGDLTALLYLQGYHQDEFVHHETA